jgi:hypothetical protein
MAYQLQIQRFPGRIPKRAVNAEETLQARTEHPRTFLLRKDH